MRKFLFLLTPLLLLGCGDPSTKAPPITAPPRKPWTSMSKQEKVDLIKKQSMPEQARQDELKKIQSGQD